MKQHLLNKIGFPELYPLGVQTMPSALSHLVCPECNERFDPDKIQTYCLACDSPLVAAYDLVAARDVLNKEDMGMRPKGLWRWRELLPLRDQSNEVTLGEGESPILHAPRLGSSLNLAHLYIKDESGQPTGSFKARGLAVAVAKAMELGVKEFVIPTAGNAGGALCAYAARAGLKAHVYMPEDAPPANIAEIEVTGADLHLVDGLISDAGRLAGQAAEEHGWFNVSTFKEPYRLEGKKTMGLEIAEAFAWELPDVIIYPTGGGTGLVGIWKAFQELETLGWIDERRPKMVVVQAEGCAPAVKAFHDGQDRMEAWQDASTIASGIRVPLPFADRLILDVLHKSAGTAIAVSDEEILKAQKAIASYEGIFPAPEGAATLAGLIKLLEGGWLDRKARIVLCNTGSGLKYIHQQQL
jgi:threonine synthase